ncbi:WD domain, G-beta repeat-containing protein [Toxoplasma gondii MAS]|uniref:WD domain, G-beta repeat-containing protein n=1 Tax=Toxoplasma gondii MAS TaxID=943118 RepID=A0A086QCL0_TOXGO|nr:WD domain, G-beta repeat-containing protein [Toxoplasma gondii MAS]
MPNPPTTSPGGDDISPGWRIPKKGTRRLCFPFRHCSTLRPHSAAVNFLCFSRDNNYLLAASSDKTVSLSNPTTGCHVATFRAGPSGGHDCVVTCVSSGFGNRTFLSTGADGRSFLWDVETQQVTKTLPRHRGQLRACLLLDGVNDRPPRVPQSGAGPATEQGGTELRCSSFHSQKPSSTLPQPAATFFSHVAILAGDDRAIRIYDVRINNRHSCIQEMQDAKDSITGLLSTGDSVLACSADGCVYEYDIRQGRLYTDEIFQPITSFCLSRDGQSLLLSCSDGLLRLQERTTGEIVLGLSGHTQRQQYRLEAQFTMLDLACRQGTSSSWKGHALSFDSSSFDSTGDHDFTHAGDFDQYLGIHGRDEDRLPEYRMCVLSGSEDGSLVGWDLQEAALTDAENKICATEWMVIRQQIHGNEEDECTGNGGKNKRDVALLCLQIEEEQGCLVTGASDGRIKLWQKR